MLHHKALHALLGDMDIYLLDHLLKGRVHSHFKILDAGCGQGRNIFYLLRTGHQVYGFDKDEGAISLLLHQLGAVDSSYPKARFVVGDAAAIPFPNASFDFVISSAVLHFAQDEGHFYAMVDELSRVMQPGAFLFVRMTTTVGMEGKYQSLANGKYLLPDGSIRFLFTTDMIADLSKKYGLRLAEPLKTVLVHEQRSMSILLFQKNKS
ncbi:MAG: class I SAM-dependent methyltransferase [Cyclobacteriaceae bacterium]|nr:class I SAM-dependent methyltransferase [Cyclobacteriaceae bacterium]